MMWAVQFDPRAERELKKLPPEARAQISDFLDHVLTQVKDPKQLGIKMQGRQKNEPPTWRYRVWDFRVICTFKESQIVIIVLRVGNRREIYKH